VRFNPISNAIFGVSKVNGIIVRRIVMPFRFKAAVEKKKVFLAVNPQKKFEKWG
jgi:hypothetical protein